MNATIDNAAPAPVPPEDEVSLKAFLLSSVLWLPLAFFLWFVLRTVVAFAPVRLAAWALGHLAPELFGPLAQEFHAFTYSIVADVSGVPGLPTSRLMVEQQSVNVLIYCYNVPVLIGLVMATPMSWGRTFAQIGGGLALLIPMQALGVVAEVLKTVALDLSNAVNSALTSEGYGAVAAAAGDAAQAHAQATLASHGLGLETIALMYQFGYLILPPISAVIIWIVFNRRFIEALTGLRPEPPRAPAV